jgi:integrase
VYELKEETITLRSVWREYAKTRHLKPATLKNYSHRLNYCLKDWLDIPISTITKDMVEERHRSIKGGAMANSTMRTLRALLAYAEVKYTDADGNPILKHNPVKRLSEVRAWHRDKRRTSVLRLHQLRAWFSAVMQLDNATMRDFLITLLLTGMRRCEAISLKWDQVDLEYGVINLKDTKNGDDFVLPLSDFVWDLLKIRRFGSKSEYVFPGPKRDKPITAACKGYTRVKTTSGYHSAFMI